MKISRFYTQANRFPNGGIPFETRTSKLTDKDGTLLYQNDQVVVPDCRMVGCWVLLGQRQEYSTSKKDAPAFYDELTSCWPGLDAGARTPSGSTGVSSMCPGPGSYDYTINATRRYSVRRPRHAIPAH